jgi:hypothetical protein
MKTAAFIPIVIGALLILYILTFGEIWNNHSVQSYMVFCTGVISVDLGFIGLALSGDKKTRL